MIGMMYFFYPVTATYTLPPSQFKLGNLDAKRDWGHAKDFVEV